MAISVKSARSGQLLRVKLVRQWFGLSQEEFARVLGVGRATVVRWETSGGGPLSHSAEGKLVLALLEIKSLATKAFGRQAKAWFHDRMPALKGETARETLLKRGPVPVLMVLRANWVGLLVISINRLPCTVHVAR
jgi:DNA-binding XRE family transcriptional regulator